jgi:hypothetical protein
METYEQYREYCLNLAAKRHFEAAGTPCVCSTLQCEVLGTIKVAKAFEWAEQYPKLAAIATEHGTPSSVNIITLGKGLPPASNLLKLIL